MISTRTLSISVKVMNSIGITNDDFTLTYFSYQFDSTIYNDDHQIVCRLRYQETHDNRRKFEDSWWFGSATGWTLGSSWKQWPVFRCVPKELTRLFHRFPVPGWSISNRICDRVRWALSLADEFLYIFPQIEDEIDRALEIPTQKSFLHVLEINKNKKFRAYE